MILYLFILVFSDRSLSCGSISLLKQNTTQVRFLILLLFYSNGNASSSIFYQMFAGCVQDQIESVNKITVIQTKNF